jgi:dienelactone hydrolase
MSTDQLRQHQQSLLDKLKAWYGPIPAGGPLNVAETERREYRTHTEIKIQYDGDPGERIPAYLLIPRGIGDARRPAIFAQHQCACACDVGKEQVVGKSVDWPDQAYGLELVREGFIVLAPDAGNIGERFDPKLREQWQTCHEIGSKTACCCGPGGPWGGGPKAVFDVVRGVDLLCQHPQVDPGRIGMIGHSTGASITLWALPRDQRIAAAVISGGSLMGVDWDRPAFGLPWNEYLQAIAPRPFFEVVGNEDHLNICHESRISLPEEERLSEKREAYRIGNEFYEKLGATDRLGLYVFAGGHCFPTDARNAAYAFLKKHLMN